MTVADTDVLIDFLAGKGEADAVERLLGQGVLGTTAITRFELLCGARTPGQLARMTRLLETIPALPLNERAADAAAGIRCTLERLGHPIGMAGSLIAGIWVKQWRHVPDAQPAELRARSGLAVGLGVEHSVRAGDTV